MEPPDIRTMLVDLIGLADMTQARIAARVGCGRSTITDIISGTAEPRWSLGWRIYRLHATERARANRKARK